MRKSTWIKDLLNVKISQLNVVSKKHRIRVLVKFGHHSLIVKWSFNERVVI